MKNLLTLFFTVLCTLYSVLASATSYTWNGVTSTAWGTGTNWTPNGVPGAADNVTIVTATNQPTYNGVAGVTNITMTSGTLNLGGYTLNVTGTALFNGGTITTGKISVNSTSTTSMAGTVFSCKFVSQSNNFYLNGSTFNDSTTITRKSTGTGTDNSTGGNKFYGKTVITNQSASPTQLNYATPYKADTAYNKITFNQEGAGHLIFGGNNSVPSVFYEKVIMNKKSGSNNGDLVAGWYGKVEFHDTIEVSNLTNRDLYIGYNTGSQATLTDDAIIVIGSAGFTGRYLVLEHVRKLNNNPINITLGGTAIFYPVTDNIIYGDFTVNAPQVLTAGTTYYGNVVLQKTGATDNWSTGGNIFNGEFSLTNNGSGAIGLGNGAVPDTFRLKATFTTNNYNISVAHAYSGHYFGGSMHLVNTNTGSVNISTYGACTIAGNIYVTNTSTGGINFGSATSGTIYLTAGRKIIEGTSGFNSGSLLLRRFYQFGSAAMDLNFSSSAAVTIGPYVTLGGDLTYSGGEFYLNGATYNGNVSFTKTGSVNATSSGGNVFNGTATFNSNGTGTLALANTTGDDYNGDATFIKTANKNFYPANEGINTFAGDITFSGTYTGIMLSKSGGTSILDGGNEQVFTSRSGDYARKLKVAKSANSVTVVGTLGIMDSLLFNDGIIKTTGSDMIALDDNCKINTPTDSSYVEGKVKKTGNDAFTFPVGASGQYRSIAMTAPANTTDAYTAEYFYANSNSSYAHSSKDAAIAGLSQSEYWKLDRNAGASNVSVTPSWEAATTSCSFASTANLKVAAWDGTTWKDKSNGGTTGTTASGTVVTSAASTVYGPYTLATSASFTCNCPVSGTFGSGNSCLTSQSLASGEIWFKFLADDANKEVTVSNKGISTTSNIDKVQIYSDCGGSMLGGDTTLNTTDTLLVVDVRNLTVGNYYYVRLVKSATGSGNADYDLCLRNGQPNTFARNPDSPWIGCGLDYMQSSLRLNTRTNGSTVAGSAAGTPFTLTIPAGAIILNAYIYITTIDDAFPVPLAPKVFDYQFEGSNMTASLLNTTIFTNGTCWDPALAGDWRWTNVYKQDVTATFNAANTSHAFNFNIANATRYTGFGTVGCDVTGATLLVVYKVPCTTGAREGRLVLWEGLDVVDGGGNGTYTINNLGAYANNTNEEGFAIISDIENNGTNIRINASANQAITGNMHNFVTMAAPAMPVFTPNLNSVVFNTIGNGSDCYAVTVLGAYTQDNSHSCYCGGGAPSSMAFNTNFCNSTASAMIALNSGSSTVTTALNVIINGTFTVNTNLIFDHCSSIIMGPGAKIEIAVGCTLSVKSSYMGSCDYMWDGIYLRNSNSRLEISSSQLEAATNAVVSENGAPYSISATDFHCCYKGIVVRNYTPAVVVGVTTPPHPGVVVGNSFDCATQLIVPHAYERAFIGVEATNAFGVTIGSGASGANTFDNHIYGIKAYNSQVFAYNNTFTNIYENSLNPVGLLFPLHEGAIHATRGNIFTLTAGMGLTVGASGTNNGNTFTGCNVGVYSDRLKTNVEYNHFNNLLKGTLIQNVRHGSTVSHNKYVNTSSWLGKGIGVQVDNLTANPISGATRLTIRNNKVTDYNTGIWARNISAKLINPGAKPFWLYQDSITYSTTNNSALRYGIRLESCYGAIVAQSSVTKTTAVSLSGEQSRLRGISLVKTSGSRVYANTLTRIGQGIYTSGNDNLSQFYCNQLTSNYNGFFFGPATSITQQGNTTWNTDNQWSGNIGTNRMASGSGFMINTYPDIDWYYRNAGGAYNPNPIDFEVFLAVNVFGNSHTTNHCGSTQLPPDAIVDTPDDDMREQYFGPIMRDETEYEQFEEANKQYDNELAYLTFKYDDDWFTLGADDTDYSDWYDAVEAGNIGKLLALRELADTIINQGAMMMAQPMDTAQTLITGITPTKLIESNELAVWEIYFRTFAIDDYNLSAADSATLFNIAYQVGSEGGIGVYMARIMLNIDVDLGESNKTDEEVLLAEPENKEFALYPNPAKDEVSVFFRGYEEGEQVIIELFELTGRRTISKQLAISDGIININTSALEAGIYMYKINIASGDGGNGKLVIVK